MPIPVECFYEETMSVFPQHVVAGGTIVAIETNDVLNETAKAVTTTAIAALTMASVDIERRFCGRRPECSHHFERCVVV